MINIQGILEAYIKSDSMLSQATRIEKSNPIRRSVIDCMIITYGLRFKGEWEYTLLQGGRFFFLVVGQGESHKFTLEYHSITTQQHQNWVSEKAKQQDEIDTIVAKMRATAETKMQA